MNIRFIFFLTVISFACITTTHAMQEKMPADAQTQSVETTMAPPESLKPIRKILTAAKVGAKLAVIGIQVYSIYHQLRQMSRASDVLSWDGSKLSAIKQNELTFARAAATRTMWTGLSAIPSFAAITYLIARTLPSDFKALFGKNTPT